MRYRQIIAALFGLLFSAASIAVVVSVSTGTPTQAFRGLSSDTKPTAGILMGATFAETDTGKTYVWTANTATGTGANWVEFIPRVSLGTLLACEDQTLSSCWISLAGNTSNVTQAIVNNQIKASPGEMVGIWINSTTAGTLRFWDQVSGTCNAGAKGGATTFAIVGWNPYPAKFGTGICVTTGGTIDATLVYR